MTLGEFVYCRHCRRTIKAAQATRLPGGDYRCPEPCICAEPLVCGCVTVSASDASDQPAPDA